MRGVVITEDELRSLPGEKRRLYDEKWLTDEFTKEDLKRYRSAVSTDAQLGGARLDNANLRRASLTSLDLTAACLSGADLRNARLVWATLTGAQLNGADLRGALMAGADLQYAFLKDANLNGADLRGADLRGADLTGAHLEQTKLLGVVITPEQLQRGDKRRIDEEQLLIAEFDAKQLERYSIEVSKDAQLGGAILDKVTHDSDTTWPLGGSY